jgi:hypothetical protein
MLSVEQRLERLERRNAALEVQNLWMKRAGLVAVVVAGAALWIGPAGAQNKEKAKAIEVTGIKLVDDAGKTRMDLGVDKDGVGLDIRDANGKTRVVLGEGTIEGLGEGAGLWVFDEKERPRVGLGMGKDGGMGLIVLDEDGKKVAAEGKAGK